MILEFLCNKLVRSLFNLCLNTSSMRIPYLLVQPIQFSHSFKILILTLSQNLPLSMAPPLVDKVLNFVF